MFFSICIVYCDHALAVGHDSVDARAQFNLGRTEGERDRGRKKGGRVTGGETAEAKTWVLKKATTRLISPPSGSCYVSTKNTEMKIKKCMIL